MQCLLMNKFDGEVVNAQRDDASETRLRNHGLAPSHEGGAPVWWHSHCRQMHQNLVKSWKRIKSIYGPL